MLGPLTPLPILVLVGRTGRPRCRILCLVLFVQSFVSCRETVWYPIQKANRSTCTTRSCDTRKLEHPTTRQGGDGISTKSIWNDSSNGGRCRLCCRHFSSRSSLASSSSSSSSSSPLLGIARSYDSPQWINSDYSNDGTMYIPSIVRTFWWSSRYHITIYTFGSVPSGARESRRST